MRHIRSLTAFMAAVIVPLPTPAIAASCQATPQSMNFGNYDTLSTVPTDGTGNISIQCDAETSFSIALSSGTGSFPARQMTSATDVLEYNLYPDASRLVIWGDGNAGSDTSIVSRAAASADVTIYGRIPARQNVSAGEYSDIVVVTISY